MTQQNQINATDLATDLAAIAAINRALDTPPPRSHGAAALMQVPRLLAMRAAMNDTSLLPSTRDRAAQWLRENGSPGDKASAATHLEISTVAQPDATAPDLGTLGVI